MILDVEDCIVIARPLGEVFDLVADQINAPRWQNGLEQVRRVTDGPPGVGTKHVVVRKFLGRRLELINEYAHFEPNAEITFTGASGPSRFEVSYLTEETAKGIRLSCHIRMEQKGLFALGDRVVAASLRRDFAANLRNLKALLETRAE